MKLLLTIALALVALAAPAFAQNQYAWTISSSQSSAFANTGGIAPGGLAHLYLWYYCSNYDGMVAADFALGPSGGIVIGGFTPGNGFLNSGIGNNLLLAVAGCPHGPVVAGDITVIWLGSAASICIVPSNTGLRVTVDCSSPTPNAWPLAAIGWKVLSAPPCVESLEFCSPISTEPTNWGAMKGLYR